MLTGDLVRARRQGGELKVTQLRGRARARAVELAEAYLELAQQHVGGPRGELEDDLAAISAGPREQKLSLGLRKLIDDLCLFEGGDSGDSRELRRQLFTLAAEVRRELGPGERFDRDAVLRRSAEARGRGETVDGLIRALYSDLRQAHRLVEAPSISPKALVDRYDTAQIQAVLLRASRVVVDVACASAPAYRFLFRQVKFRRLLHTIHRSRVFEGGYRIEIDGPYSLFSSVTKYGMQLALLLPAIQGCHRWSLKADLLWGRDRAPLDFQLSGSTPGAEASADEDALALLPDEGRELLERIRALSSGWESAPSSDILELPGVGLCVPDLRFVRSSTGEVAYLEILGFWSRDAVWQRVELVEAGLPHHILFAVPKRLRVSESVLEEELPGALYVYRGKMSPKVIVQKLDAMVGS